MPKKSDNETKTREGKILNGLLEGSKTTPQLLVKLGYAANQHDYISKALKNLKTKLFIESEPARSEVIDAGCKLWSIIPSYKNFKRMLDDYPSLFVSMHKSELVINSILTVTECDLAVSECSKNVFSPPVPGVPIKHIFFTIPEEFKQDLKEKMRLSPEFFRRFLNNKPLSRKC
jgi:hypothetical protein